MIAIQILEKLIVERRYTTKELGLNIDFDERINSKIQQAIDEIKDLQLKSCNGCLYDEEIENFSSCVECSRRYDDNYTSCTTQPPTA